LRAHAVRYMTGGTREAIINMTGVVAEAGICENLRQVVALAAHGVGAIDAQIGTGIQIRQKPTWGCRLAKFVAAFQNVTESRSVRTVRTDAAEFAIVVAVVTVGTQDARTDGARGIGSIQIQHLAAQAGLRQGAAAVVCYWMA